LTTTVYARTKTFSIDSGRSKLEYSFKSTLHPVKGVAREFSGEFIFNDVESLSFRSGEVIVNPALLDSYNKKRDSNMRKMLEVHEFPKINYEIKQLEKIKQTDNGSYEGIFKGALTIKDVARDVDVDVIIQELGDDYILTGQCEISLAAFDLKPPSVLGIIKVFDPVRINFEVHFK
jgi:polyisoprenoid-binding protein YceI